MRKIKATNGCGLLASFVGKRKVYNVRGYDWLMLAEMYRQMARIVLIWKNELLGIGVFGKILFHRSAIREHA
jgi:hypothetical protein